MSFTLPIALPLLNQMLRKHWAVRRKERLALSWEIHAAVSKRPLRPMKRARVTIERWSIRVADTDNLVASAKNLVDILCLRSDTHPYGLGFITDDSPDLCELIVRGVKAPSRKDIKTVVTIEALA